MDSIQELFKIDFSYILLSVFAILIGVKAIVTVFEWIVSKLGLETKWMRTKREERDLIIQTSKELIKLKEDHIEDMKQSDAHDNEIRQDITEIRQDIRNLTDMFISRGIDDMRWEINDFANKISDGKRCNKDSYRHCIKTYEKYEKILCENGLENGEIEISMELINESYKRKLKEGF